MSSADTKLNYKLCDFEELEDNRAVAYSQFVPSTDAPITIIHGTKTETFTDPKVYHNGYHSGRYLYDLTYELERCQCKPIVLELDGENKPSRVKYEHPPQFCSSTSTTSGNTSTDSNSYTNTLIIGSCPNRLAVTLKDEKTLYLVMTENGSMTDSIVSVHANLKDAEDNLTTLLDRKIQDWDWLTNKKTYIVKYDKPVKSVVKRTAHLIPDYAKQ